MAQKMLNKNLKEGDHTHMDNNNFIGIALEDFQRGGLVRIAPQGVFNIKVSGIASNLFLTGSIAVESSKDMSRMLNGTLRTLDI